MSIVYYCKSCADNQVFRKEEGKPKYGLCPKCNRRLEVKAISNEEIHRNVTMSTKDLEDKKEKQVVLHKEKSSLKSCKKHTKEKEETPVKIKRTKNKKDDSKEGVFDVISEIVSCIGDGADDIQSKDEKEYLADVVVKFWGE